jgi:surfeit locus 1 family protein
MSRTDLVRRGRSQAQGVAGATRAGIIGTIVVLAVAATCVRLGLWQLDRLEQRRALNALAESRMAEPPVDADRLADDSADAAYRRIRLAGSCEGEPIVLAARSRHGAPGVHLLCRFRTAGGRGHLLDRGWLPSADARTVEREWLAAPPRDTVIDALAVPFPPGRASRRAGGSEAYIEQADDGVRLAEAEPRVVYRLNRSEASAATGIALPDWYAQAIGPDDRFPIPADPPDPGEGPHLGYAVQWFSFAAIGLIGWLVLQRRRPGTRGTNRPA